ncbi:MAG TPA: Crp/Fnr family transcriptional regulator [Trueperaceae bacterium]|nr:Crp/Fnr family transcriptional regulator [Trueperaceae bacterium]HRP47043.1 Crp/Fnr family transcriptional regulator [Trueperaceae bacterium]
MTAAADASHHLPNHPLGRGGVADPRTALQHDAALPTPAPASGSNAATVIPAGAASVAGMHGGMSAHRAHSLEGLSDAWRLPARAHARFDQLYLSGAPAEAALIIEAGLVALELDVPRARIMALAGPGDVIGALMPGHGHYLESATALSGEVVVRVLDERVHAELAPQDLTEVLLSAAAARVVTLTHALEDAEHPVPARVARAFQRLGSRFGQKLADGTVRLTLPVTHDTLAAMVGAARETTTAVIAQLRQLDLVQGTRGNYRIRPAELAEYALEVALSGTALQPAQ